MTAACRCIAEQGEGPQTIAEWLERDPRVSAAVIEQRLRPLGYNGGHTILQEHVCKVGPHLTAPRFRQRRAHRRLRDQS